MPDQLAHFYFAKQTVCMMDAEHRKMIDPESPEFRLGTFGPDPLFHDRGARRSEGFAMHKLSGRECMERMRGPVEQRMKGALDYAAGFFTHYALDKLCHPDILHRVSLGEAVHVAMETAYDRELMLKGIGVPMSRAEADAADYEAAAAMYRTMDMESMKKDVLAYCNVRRLLLKGGGTVLANIGGMINRKWKGIVPYKKPSGRIRTAMNEIEKNLLCGVNETAHELELCLDALISGGELSHWLDYDFSGRTV